MGKYQRYKNGLEKYLSSEEGRRVLSFCYSWGASIVVIGAMFKIVHLPLANEILCFALVVEALVFFLSAFERPMSEYHWEDVFPVLKSKNPLDRPDFAGNTIITGGGEGGITLGGATIVGNYEGSPVAAGTAHLPTPPTPQESVNIGMAAMGLNVSEEDSRNLANSIQKLNEAAEQISKMADLTEATQTYIDQMSSVSRNLERFSTVTGSLSEVSDSIVNSCKKISGVDSENTEDKVVGYVEQMEQLNQHLSGLNQFYEVHLHGLRSQMETIHLINAGLNRIRETYDHSVVDSTAFRAENEKMAQLLSQLNQVYTRLLQAMTINMPAGGGMPYGAQPPYAGQVYPQQPPYGQAR
jgi:gliding motility-associated protein GldL